MISLAMISGCLSDPPTTTHAAQPVWIVMPSARARHLALPRWKLPHGSCASSEIKGLGAGATPPRQGLTS
jgi:hypothetical protein